MLKRYLFPLVLTMLAATIIVLDQGNLYNQYLYAAFYTGVLLFPVSFLFQQQGKTIYSAGGMLVAAALFCSLLVRIYFYPFVSRDYSSNFVFWFAAIVDGGGFEALKGDFADYTPPFQYLLWLLTKIPVQQLTALKSASVLFDYTAAYLVYRIVCLYASHTRALIAAMVLLFLPTVVVNSSAWAQNDIIYTTLLLASLYYAIKQKSSGVVGWFAMAFAVKLQSVFFVLPLLLLLIRGQIRLWHVAVAPLVYVACCLPAALAGRPWGELLGIYLGQAGSGSLLTFNAPSVYALIPDAPVELFTRLGIAFTALIIVCMAFLFWHNRHQQLSYEWVLFTATVSVLLIPYFLPKMHERYFFLADVFTLLLAFRYPRLFWLPVAMNLVSLLSYAPFLLGKPVVEMKYISLALLFLVVFTTTHYLRQFFFNAHAEQSPR